MHLSPLVALVIWIPIGAILFRRFSLRVAILINFLAGWAVLPGANYVPTPVAFPYWILPVCLPGAYFINKATVLGIAALIGVLCFHRRELRRFRLRVCDIPIALLCFVPLLSSIANHLAPGEGIRGVLYVVLAWAIPYFLGRHCFSDRQSLLLAARAIVVTGILYSPICLFELFTGPQVYAHLYGFQPYRWIGAARYFGFRPVGFLEDGNQLGIWMASSALIASALWARGLAVRVLRLPVKWAAAYLIGGTLLCQSVGSILLLGLLLPLACFSSRRSLRIGIAVVLLGSVLYACLQLSHRIPWRELSQTNPIAHSIADKLRELGRNSLGWRISRDEAQAAIATQKPFLGFGEWNWWKSSGTRPWDLWLLVFGMYGTFGALAMASVLAGPIVRAACFPPPGAGPELTSLLAALAMLLFMSALDSLLNGAIILPYLLLAGGLSSTVSSNPPYVRQARSPSLIVVA
jgi:hypothetical protein